MTNSAKQLGMKCAADKHREVLEKARKLAVLAGKHKWGYASRITIDDVQALLPPTEKLGNAAGSVFSGKEWECVGFRPSTRLGNHGRIVRVWRLK